jgi:hypothetical protein
MIEQTNVNPFYKSKYRYIKIHLHRVALIQWYIFNDVDEKTL